MSAHNNCKIKSSRNYFLNLHISTLLKSELHGAKAEIKETQSEFHGAKTEIKENKSEPHRAKSEILELKKENWIIIGALQSQ